MTTQDISAALAAVAPSAAGGDAWIAALAPAMEKYNIACSPHRIAMFIGQVAEESGFHPVEEDLYYSTAERIHEVWPSRFPTLAAARPFVGQPQKLANRVYASRLGNGNELSGDGWKFRGAGLIQLTGRTAFTSFGATVGKTPEEAAAWCLTKEGAAESACWFWSKNNLNSLADAWDITRATERINGGLTNLAQRKKLCNQALSAMPVGGAVAAPVAQPADPADQLDAEYNPGS